MPKDGSGIADEVSAGRRYVTCRGCGQQAKRIAENVFQCQNEDCSILRETGRRSQWYYHHCWVCGSKIDGRDCERCGHCNWYKCGVCGNCQDGCPNNTAQGHPDHDPPNRPNDEDIPY